MFKKFHSVNGTAQLVLMRRLLDVTSSLSPGLAAWLAYRIWFMTRRYREPGREKLWRQQARTSWFHHQGRDVAVYSWGAGPTVLLVHGWNGRGPQLAGFAQALEARGYRVIAFDAPGHGFSPGKHTHAFEIAQLIRALTDHYGPVQGIIAHSFGVLCTVRALYDGARASSFVGLSSPTQLHWLVQLYYRHFGVKDKVRTLFEAKLAREFGPSLWQELAAERLAPALSLPALLLHDRDDQDVSWEQSQLLADAWPQAVLHLTTGLGHNRILRDRDVWRQVAEFIDQARVQPQ